MSQRHFGAFSRRHSTRSFSENDVVAKTSYQAPVAQKLDSAIHRIKIYPVDNVIGFPNTCPLDSDLFGG